MVLNPKCAHYDRFDQSKLEFQEINAHVQESTFSVHLVEFDPDVKVSCQDPFKCQNSEVFSKWYEFYEKFVSSQSTFSQFILFFLRD